MAGGGTSSVCSISGGAGRLVIMFRAVPWASRCPSASSMVPSLRPCDLPDWISLARVMIAPESGRGGRRKWSESSDCKCVRGIYDKLRKIFDERKIFVL